METEFGRFDLAVKAGESRYGHIHRHALYRKHVEGRRVLDVMSDNGSGAAMLAQAAAWVVGLSTDPSAVRKAQKHYLLPNLEFTAGDCLEMPFSEDSFDVVVCDMPLDVVKDIDSLLVQARRVLRPDGIFLASMPGGMSAEPLRSLLERHFGHVRMTGLRMGLVSFGFRVGQLDTRDNLPSALTYVGDLTDRPVPHVATEELRLEAPDCVLATCSVKPLAQEQVGASLLFLRDHDLWLEDGASGDPLAKAHDLGSRFEPPQYDTSKATLSRLLTRMTGEVVGDDDESIVEALFVLSQLTTERRSELEAMQAKLVIAQVEVTGLQRDLAETKAGLVVAEQGLSAQQQELADAARSLDRERDASMAARLKFAEAGRTLDDMRIVRHRQTGELVAIAQEAERLRVSGKEQRAELARAKSRIADLQADYSAQQAREAKAQQQAAQSQSLIEQLTEEIARLRPPASGVVDPATVSPREFGASPGRTQSGVSVEIDRQAERFARTHRLIQKQMTHASRDIAGRVGQAEPRTTTTFKKWVHAIDRDAPPFRTVLFNSDWIATQAQEVGKIRLGRYLRDPALWQLDPHPLFDAVRYLSANTDVAASGINPLKHYLEHGWREGRNPHPYFANDWYLAQNTDLLGQFHLSPLEHYILHGWHEGRWPNPLFDPRAYLARYPDVAADGMEPLTHFVAYGRGEKRAIPSSSIMESWVSLLPAADRHRSIFDFILNEEPLALSSTSEPAAQTADWPPTRLNEYWLPQALRDAMTEGGGEVAIELFTYLCSVMEEFRDKQDAFIESEHCRQISQRARQISAARSQFLPDRPEASIIIPVYNNVLDTLLCITSVLEDETARSYEIIVADDGSTDGTPQVIATLDGVVRYIRQPRNLGFVGNCNEAAKQARGEHLVFLNNDTLVFPEWLDAMLGTFELHEKVGLTGSKLISWDGTLQEAGGIYWRDGSAWNFGRGGNARAPEFNYLKDVDYVSGAAIAVPAAVWKEMGGFDDIYAPAYCEDADLAFRLRAAGFRTLLNPRSEVLHHEGRSHGRDISSGIKAYQVKNQETFLERWRETLGRDHFPNAQNVLRARDRSRERRHVLVIDHYVPQWDQDAGSRSTFMCIEAFLRLGYAVTLWPENLWNNPHYTPKLQEMGVEVIYGPSYRGSFGAFIKARKDLYDTIFLNRPHIASQFIDNLREHSNARIIYYGHDLHFRRMTIARNKGEPISLEEISSTRAQELEVCRNSDVVLYPDFEEVEVVAREVGGSRTFATLPVYAYDDRQFARGAERLQAMRVLSDTDAETKRSLLFVGGFNHPPNAAGILWFVREVMPEVRARLGRVRLVIVGSNPPESVTTLSGGDIDVTGFVSDERLAAFYDQASLVIAPLRYGGGVKGKVIEAMAGGVPLVTTPIGAQGLNEPDQIAFLAADEVAQFADAVVQGLTDRDEARARARRAWEYARQKYSMQALEALLRDVS